MEWNTEEVEKVQETLLSISKDINEFSLDYQSVLKSLEDEYQVCYALFNQIYILYGCFHEYNTTFNEKTAQNLDPESEQAVALRALEQKADDIYDILNTCEHATGEFLHYLKYSVEALKRKLGILQCFQTASVSEVQDLVPLDFENFQTFSSNLKELKRCWDELDLTRKVIQCLEILREI